MSRDPARSLKVALARHDALGLTRALVLRTRPSPPQGTLRQAMETGQLPLVESALTWWADHPGASIRNDTLIASALKGQVAIVDRLATAAGLDPFPAALLVWIAQLHHERWDSSAFWCRLRREWARETVLRTDAFEITAQHMWAIVLQQSDSALAFGFLAALKRAGDALGMAPPTDPAVVAHATRVLETGKELLVNQRWDVLAPFLEHHLAAQGQGIRSALFWQCMKRHEAQAMTAPKEHRHAWRPFLDARDVPSLVALIDAERVSDQRQAELLAAPVMSRPRARPRS